MHARGSFYKCFLTSVMGSAGESTCHQARQPKFDLWNPHVGRRAPVPPRLSDFCMCTVAHDPPSWALTQDEISRMIIEKNFTVIFIKMIPVLR